MPNRKLTRALIVFLALVLAGCSGSVQTSPSPTSNPVALRPTSTDLPTLTPFQPATFTPAPPTATPTPSLTVWLSPALPAEIVDHFTTTLALATGLPGEISLVDQPAAGSLRLDVSLPGQTDWQTLQAISWVYALVAPFRTLLDGVTQADLRRFWEGGSQGPFDGQPLLMEASTLAAFEKVWGQPDSTSVHVLPADSLIATAWNTQQAWAIVPFEALDPRWKVLAVDGKSPIEKDFDPQGYPLSLTFALQAPAGSSDVLRDSALAQAAVSCMPSANRDASKLTVLVMTGTTALTRATAYEMEVHGLTFPDTDIKAWLHNADLVHVSNEVSFYSGCPYPNPSATSLNFCSAPDYIQLLDDAGVNVVELTGNHNNDVLERFRVDAWSTTADLYEQRGWLYFGGGRTLDASMQAATTTVNGNRIAYVGCNSAGPAYAWATPDQPGAAPCGDWGWIRQEIAQLKQLGYLVVATVQYDEDYTDYATYPMMDAFRALADAGATIVDGSQAHTPKEMEFYNGSFIHYGLGNLFFDQMGVTIDGVPVPSTRQEFIDRHVIYDGRYISTELLTAELEDFARPRPMTEAERSAFLQEIFAVWAQRHY